MDLKDGKQYWVRTIPKHWDKITWNPEVAMTHFKLPIYWRGEYVSYMWTDEYVFKFELDGHLWSFPLEAIDVRTTPPTDKQQKLGRLLI